MALQTRMVIDGSQLADLVRTLEAIPKAGPRAIRNAVNRTARRVNTQTMRAITSTIAVKRKDIAVNSSQFRRRGGVLLSTARTGDNTPVATVKIGGRRIPVYRFGAKQTKRGVTYRIRKGGGRQFVASGFIQTMPTGYVGAFKRTGRFKQVRGRRGVRQREIITGLKGPSIPQVAEDSPIVDRLTLVDGVQILQTEMSRQLDYLLAKARAKQEPTGVDGPGAGAGG